MTDKGSGYKHSASDKKLDHDADAAKDTDKKTDSPHSVGPGHDAAKVSRHDDAGKDRLFEGREQHDDAERKSEKGRLAKDVAAHDHADHPADDGAASGTA